MIAMLHVNGSTNNPFSLLLPLYAVKDEVPEESRKG